MLTAVGSRFWLGSQYTRRRAERGWWCPRDGKSRLWTQNGDGPEHYGARVESMVECRKGVVQGGIG